MTIGDAARPALEGGTADETADFDYQAPAVAPAPPRRRDPHTISTGAEIGRYIVLEPLGQGGMGVVYAAYDPQLDRKVAVKLLRENTEAGQALLLREAQAMARLTDANVVAVFDAGLADDRVFVAMELVSGKNLAEWLRAQPRSWREVMRALVEAGRGLAAVHRAGLVHRDFKPENVLVGADGRCRVSDFGLAHVVAAGDRSDGPSLDLARRSTGGIPTLRDQASLGSPAVAGTPTYMAPEQWQGAPPDALTDQFSFGVAVYRALYGALPYEVDELRGWTAGPSALAPREPPAGGGLAVPRWVWRALAPALAPRPQDRYPTVDRLLEALGRDPVRRRRRILAASAVIATVVGSLAVAASSARTRPTDASQLCRGADRHLVGVWDDAARSAVRASFASTGHPDAVAAAARAEAVLDGYARAWAAGQTEACAAARIRGDQSDEIYTLRTLCLNADLDQLDALVDVFAEADAEVVSRAVQAASGLATVSRCSDVDALTSDDRRPTDPAERQRYDEAEAALGEASVLHLAGRTAAAEERARAVVEQVSGRFPSLEARAQILRATILIDGGRHAEAVAVVEDALVAGEAALDAGSVAHAYAIRLFEAGILGRGDDVELLERRGRVWLTHAKGEARADATGSFLNSLGAIAFYGGRWLEAADYFGQAYDAYAQIRPGHWLLARNLHNRAEALVRAGQYVEAQVAGERALAIKTSALGDGHPELVSTLNLVARIRLASADDRQALALAGRARELALAAGADLDRAESLEIMGESLARDPATDERALAVLREGLALTDDPTLRQTEVRASTLHQLGTTLVRRGAPADALAAFREGVAIRERNEGAGGSRVATSLIGLGCAQARLGRGAAARDAIARAVRIVGPDVTRAAARALVRAPAVDPAATNTSACARRASGPGGASGELTSDAAVCEAVEACRPPGGRR